jgi:hypothetical protein
MLRFEGRRGFRGIVYGAITRRYPARVGLGTYSGQRRLSGKILSLSAT